MTSSPTAEQIAAQEELKPAAGSPKKLAKTGPTEDLYVVMLLTIAWFNRKKAGQSFQSQRLNSSAQLRLDP